MTTTSAPVNAFLSPSSSFKYPVTFYSSGQSTAECLRQVKLLTATEEICDKSAVTPGVPTTSKRESSSISGLALSKSDRGYPRNQSAEIKKSYLRRCTWPMPPEAPQTTEYGSVSVQVKLRPRCIPAFIVGNSSSSTSKELYAPSRLPL